LTHSLAGVHFVSWEGALTHVSCKLGLKKIFAALWGAGAPTAPPGYAYAGFCVPCNLCDTADDANVTGRYTETTEETGE